MNVKTVDPLIGVSSQRPSKIFTLFLDWTVNTRYKKELKKYKEYFVIYKSLHLSAQTITLFKDPQDFPSATIFRDALQRTLKFEGT